MEQIVNKSPPDGTTQLGRSAKFLVHLERPFLMSVGVILFVTGTAKLFSAGGSQRALQVADPILLISYKHLFLIVGLIELGIAGYLLFKDAPQTQLLIVAWLSSNFLLYRIGIYWLGVKAPCGCLGAITDAFSISPTVISGMMAVVCAYLLGGSCLLLINRIR